MNSKLLRLECAKRITTKFDDKNPRTLRKPLDLPPRFWHIPFQLSELMKSSFFCWPSGVLAFC